MSKRSDRRAKNRIIRRALKKNYSITQLGNRKAQRFFWKEGIGNKLNTGSRDDNGYW